MITINRKSFQGKNLSMLGDKIYIDGKLITGDDNQKEINITVDANIESLHIDYCNNLHVIGDCQSVVSKNGDILIKGNVIGDVINKNGNIICRDVAGNVDNKNGTITHL